MTQKTNVEFVTELMEYSKTGGLMQMFVIAALEKYSEAVKGTTEEQWANEFISLPAWKACAEEILEALDKR